MQELTVQVKDAEIIYGEEEFEEAEELEISCYRPLGEAIEAVCRRSIRGLLLKIRGGKLVSLVENIFMRQQSGVERNPWIQIEDVECSEGRGYTQCLVLVLFFLLATFMLRS